MWAAVALYEFVLSFQAPPLGAPPGAARQHRRAPGCAANRGIWLPYPLDV